MAGDRTDRIAESAFRQRRHRFAVHHRARCAGDQADVNPVVPARLVERLDHLRHALRLHALAKRRLIRGITTDEIMEMSRGESAVYRRKKK